MKIIHQINGYTEVTTPFLDKHNDFIQFYYKSDNGNILLTDDGYIIGDIKICGIYKENNKDHEKKIEGILNRFNVLRKDDELLIVTSGVDFENRKADLIQAILEIDNLF